MQFSIGIIGGALVIVVVVALWLKNRRIALNVVEKEQKLLKKDVEDRYEKIFQSEIKDFD